MSELHIARNGINLGAWDEAEIPRLVREGTIMPEDHYWKEGMSEWQPLPDGLRGAGLPPIPPPPPPTSLPSSRANTETAWFPVGFGSAYGVDKFGFVKSGSITLSPGEVEITGPRHWPVGARIGVFIVATQLAWFALGGLASLIPDGDSMVAHAAGLLALLFVILGGPMLALTLTHYFCASPATIRIERTGITGIKRSGDSITFMAPKPETGKPAKAVFRTADQDAARRIEQELC